MAADHLVGSEREEGEVAVDPAAFFVTAGISVGLALILFGRVVPRVRDPRTAARAGLGTGLAAVVTLPLLFLGFPIVVAGAALALGLVGRAGPRRRIATAAIVLGGIVVALGAVYAVVSIFG